MIVFRDYAQIQKFLTYGAGNNDTHLNGETVLMYAAYYGHLEIVKLLVKPCRCGNIDMVKLLLKYGGLVNENNYCGYVPLTMASLEGHLEIVKLLIENGANVNYEGDIALTCAINYGHKEIVKLLLENGAIFDERKLFGSNPLATAAEECQLEMCKFLLERGARVEEDDVDDMGCSLSRVSLIYAVIGGNESIIRLFLSNGASIDKRDEEGKTALMHAASNYSLSIVQLLIEHGTNVNLRSRNNESALKVA